ncbi:hypothetical protein SAMN05216368_109130 [Cryobacterium flavum]|uniref:4Fe-4S ferredoxin-type domain-containing protein n=1 Tax=Cryobacterium flavum TaxID=1424659 RepID=A0A5E9G305_9MICO|nr:hypothetical protein SAMN05216368_109130 [Cryobacterium flavum]
MLYIHPDECADCGACKPVRPVKAICYENDLPDIWADYYTADVEFFNDLGSPEPHQGWVQLSGTTPLLRQYFPKGTDHSIHSSEELDWVAAELKDRPRKRLQFQKPIEAIGELLLQ